MTVTVARGDLLIAPPAMTDGRFSKTVLFVTHLNSDGSYALCLNKETDHTLRDITLPLNLNLDRNPNLYWGGPVNPSTVWMLHSTDWAVANTQPINNEWSITSHMTMFDRMNAGHWPNRFRVFFGHASWAPGQLERELLGEEPFHHSSSWLVVKKPDAEWINDYDSSELWASSCSICAQQTVDSWLA